MKVRGLMLSHNIPVPCLYNPGSPTRKRMSKKEHTMKLVDEKTGLMECLVCGEKRHGIMKPGADGKFLPDTGNA